MKKLYTLLLLLVMAGGSVSADPTVAGNEQAIVRFYPNPATSFINFEFTKAAEKGYTLQIYAFVGKKMTEVAMTSNKITISLDNYFRGVYFFQLRDKTGKIVESGKFQVSK